MVIRIERGNLNGLMELNMMDWKKDDKRIGKGSMKSADGNVYEAEWKDSNRHGKGIYKWGCENVSKEIFK
ncbi:unnamed protein product [Paramecium sonneborni]|uniref:MORN repeat protein n=1 Tax=Paramecium sonneborni TaxID=65129 RepID=A0A8S1Q094_9CILI|nr:unnamed protein product [Paramecium sonneborni]